VHVFLTGATGLVGGALAGALLDAGFRVSALMRGTGRDVRDMDGRDRIGDLVPVPGDVAASGFALAAAPEQVDLVVHCAANVDFAAPDDQRHAVNVVGTGHAIALAQRWGAPLLYVSTAFVCGRRDGAIAEAPADPEADFANGYEASKARAETLVMAAGAEGLPVAIARPAIIVGRSSDGAIARIDGFHHLFRLFGSPLLGPVPAADHAAFAIVPIDHVVAGLMAMAMDLPRFAGRQVHLAGAAPFAMADMLDTVAAYPGTHPARMVSADAYAAAALDRGQTLVHRRIGAHYFDYFQRAPDFRSDALVELAGIAPPHIDAAMFRRMVDHCVSVGFLPWR